MPLQRCPSMAFFLLNRIFGTVMYNIRNTGTGSRMWRTQGMGGNVIFREMSPNIPGNIAKYSGECPQNSRECPQTLRGTVAKHRMWPNIPQSIAKHSGECPQTFRGMSRNIPGNVAKYSGEYCKTFWGMFSNIPGNVPLPHCFYTLILWQQEKHI